MVERPILYSGPMVRALLDKRKTVTRRLIKPQPTLDRMGNLCWKGGCYGQTPEGRPQTRSLELLSPFGTPGDKLWARETWALVRPDITDGPYVETWKDWEGALPEKHPGNGWVVLYAATYGEESESVEDRGFRYRPSIHMPRWASRLTLEVVSVRAEWLHDITEEDALTEGVEPIGITFRDEARGTRVVPSLGGPYRDGFRILWESINGAESWDANPWVWRVEFKQVEGAR